ncbi:SRPBCC family protein [Micromonospora echinofusca]|uniref:Activator of HSP90 ATPase n=1 Tax=Micromonospora echinofusca TaxID=47858 RepID=A0ABS3VLX8_MICEH|nr:SRPBCC domain-containing protein [Micromonospora echinofusca]MBO4205538.1 activator of HSP90 ATPase [Micromonospora echinofusca]
MTEPKPYRVEVGIDAPPESVWRALTEPDQLRDWFGWDHDGIEAEIRYIFADHAELFPPDRIALEDGQEIQVVAADDGGTVVRALQPGALDDPRWADVYDAMEEGWRSFFAQLRYLLEDRPHGRRRTLHLTGTVTGPELVGLVTSTGVREHRYTGRYQVVVVDPQGRLVVAAAERPLDAGEVSAASVTVSGYGLDDGTFAELRAEWLARWQVVAADTEATP